MKIKLCAREKLGWIKFNYLVFADDFGLLSESLEEMVIQINLPEMIVGAGAQGLEEKTKFMTNDRYGSKFLETEVGRIEKVEKFKNLCETMQENELGKSAIGNRNSKKERVYGLAKNIYNNKCIYVLF